MKRIESVDSIRLLAIISVIVIHTTPFANNPYNSDTYYRASIIINQLARFAVPFFFVISGFFWGLKIRSGEDPFSVTKAMALRISTIFLAWSFIYLLPYNLSAIFEYGLLGPIKVAYWNALNLLEEPGKLFLQGTKVHLWFLVGLLFSLYISLVFVNRKADKSLLIFAFSLYVVGVLFKSYVDTPIGFNVDFNTRNGPFFSTLLFSSGYFLSKNKPNEKWFVYGLGLFFVGCIFHFIEIYTLMKLFGTNMKHDYVFGTYLMGVGAAVLSLSNRRILRLRFINGLEFNS